MTVVITYDVDKALYDGAKHQVSLVTTEYTYGNELLVHQRIGKNLGIRLNNRLRYAFQTKTDLENDLYFQKKTYSTGKPKQITRSTFENKKNRFDMSQTVTEREILEDYAYTGKDGRSDEVQIVITVKDNSMTAVIDFKDSELHNNFSAPAWLVPIN